MNYEVEIPKGRKKSKIFHINMLKPWKESEEECYLNVVSDEDEELLRVSREKQEVDQNKRVKRKNLFRSIMILSGRS